MKLSDLIAWLVGLVVIVTLGVLIVADYMTQTEQEEVEVKTEEASNLPLSEVYSLRSMVFSSPECTSARTSLVEAKGEGVEANSEALGGYITCLSSFAETLRSQGYSQDAKQWVDDLADSYDSLTATLREYPSRANVNEDAIAFLERSEPDTGLPSLLTEIEP